MMAGEMISYELGSGSVNPNGSWTLKQGSLSPLNFGTFNHGVQGFNSNGTLVFNVKGLEPGEPIPGLQYRVTTSAVMTVVFIGSQPTTVICPGCSAASYSSGREILTLASGLSSSPLTVIWANLVRPEPQTVLFRDDFLYTNPLLESSWTIDGIFSPQTNSGIYTSSGYMVMSNAAAPGTITQMDVHVTNPMFASSGVSNGTIVKRKMTIALIPFAVKSGSNLAQVRAGLTNLITAGNPYPQVGSAPPYGTPNTDVNSNSCSDSSVVADNIGNEYMMMDNTGAVTAVVCGDPSGVLGRSGSGFPSVYDPTRYTVFTVETFGIFCSTCSDNAYAGSAWVWFRVYQEDSSGAIIKGTDNSVNITATTVAPLSGGTRYAFVSANSNGVVTITSKIDFVQVQSFGSPVCLVAPTGFLCTRLPPVPSGIIGNNGIVGMMAWLASQIGFGDEQTGAIILFMILSFAIGFLPYFFTHNISVGAFGEMLIMGFFTYVGFFPIWTLIVIFMGGAALVVMTVMRFMGGSTMGGGSVE